MDSYGKDGAFTLVKRKWTDPRTGVEIEFDHTRTLADMLQPYWEGACQHQNTQPIFTKYSNGAVAFRSQCLKCGNVVGLSAARSKAPPNTPWEDKSIADAYARDRKTEYDNIIIEFLELADKGNKDYQEYLLSPQWRRKRELVLKRADGICEGCGEKSATQVHHFHYENIYNEFLWELAAVCDDCHHRIHDNAE